MSSWVVLEYGTDGKLKDIFGPVHDLTSVVAHCNRLEAHLIKRGYSKDMAENCCHIHILKPTKEMLK